LFFHSWWFHQLKNLYRKLEYFPSFDKHSNTPSRLLYIMPTTSVEGAITLANRLSSGGLQNLFVYGNPSEARYISTFISAAATYIGHIPLLSHYLPPNHFPIASVPGMLYSKPRLVITQRMADNPIPSHILTQPPVPRKNNLVALITSGRLDPPHQRNSGNIGFFEQAAIVGLLHTLLFTGLTSAGLFWASKAAVRKWVHQ
jgi:hypothetical protein